MQYIYRELELVVSDMLGSQWQLKSNEICRQLCHFILGRTSAMPSAACIARAAWSGGSRAAATRRTAAHLTGGNGTMLFDQMGELRGAEDAAAFLLAAILELGLVRFVHDVHQLSATVAALALYGGGGAQGLAI